MRPGIVRALAIPAAAVAALALGGAAGAAAAPGASGQGSRPAAAAPALILGYVANSGTHSVTPFDTSLGRPGQPIAVQGSPVGLLAQSDGHYVLVASSAGVTPIGTHFNKAGPLVPIPGGAASMAFGFYLWVSAGKPPANRTEIFPLPTVRHTDKPVTFAPGPGAGPAPLVYSPYTKNLYAGSALGVVTEIHVHTSKVGRVIPFGFKDAHGTAHLAVSPDGKTLYAFGSDPARTVTTVTPINLVTGKAGPPVSVGQGPQAIVFSPDSKTAYVVSTGAGPKASVAAKVTPVSTATGKAAPPIKLGPTAASLWAAITPGGAKLYVSARWVGHHGNSLFSLSTATRTILKQVRPSFPGPIAFTPDGTTAYVINGGPGLGQGTVLSITTATDTCHPGFPIGKDPAAIAVTPRWEGQTG